jgi:ferredoxin
LAVRAGTPVGDDIGVPAASGPAREQGGPGLRFTVDEDLCISCRLCHERAPQNFEVPHAAAASVVRQPVNDAEQKACLEAFEYCPTGGVQKLEQEAV